jgi:hypothetical protein
MRRTIISWLVCVLAAFCAVESLSAQGTAFTYQGQLNDTGSPANGSYDLTFALYNSSNPAFTNVAGPVTNSAVAVTNGLFTTLLDFGPGIFTGTNYWLGISVRTNGGTTFTALSPRQPLTPTPYAIFANTASNLSGTLPSAQLSGALPSAQISGTYSGAVTFSSSANNFNGSFSGNGSSLSNLNASQLTSGTVADARLSANAALRNANQTFSGANNLTGVNIFTNLGNSFSGSFFGNGLVGWISTNGTVVQAVIDHGYLLTSPQLTTVTLPSSPNVGDIVRVSGAGAGGWQVKENSGQSILGNLASYGFSYPLALPSGGDYRDVAASVDGTWVYAVGNVLGIYASSDSGKTYNQLSALSSGYWQSIACSANGKIVFVAPSPSGVIQESTNYGSTWFSTGNSGATATCTANGSPIYTANNVCSGNGTYLGRLTGGVINISSNGGSNWSGVPSPLANVSCLGVSSDCTRIVAGVTNGLLYASANSGATWTSITTTNQAWSGAWMSEDGSKFAGTVSTVGSYTGGIYYYGVSPQVNTVSTNSAISGSQGSAVELQCIGNGQFMPVSSTGTIWAN